MLHSLPEARLPALNPGAWLSKLCRCCRPNAISAANLKIFNAVILGPDDQCKIDTE